MTVNVRDLGAKGDGVADDSQAVRDALAADASVYMPRGRYRFATPVSVTRPGTSIIGDGGAHGHAATVVVSEAGGFVFESAIDHPPWGAIRSRIADLEVTGVGTGILRRTTVAVERVSLVGLTIGLHTDGQAPRNANGSSAHDVIATSCIEGFRTEGGDANTCTFVACRARVCKTGFYERSLGGFYVACASECSLAGQTSWIIEGGTTQSTLIACSSESALPPVIGHPARVLGGIWGSRPVPPQGQNLAQIVTQGEATPRWEWSQPTAAGGQVRGRLGGGEGQDAWSAWGVAPSGQADLESLRLYLAAVGSGFWQGRWCLGVGNPVTRYPAMVVARSGALAGVAQFPDLAIGVQAPRRLSDVLASIEARLAALESKP